MAWNTSAKLIATVALAIVTVSCGSRDCGNSVPRIHETADRLPERRMQQLVAEPISVAEQKGLPAGERAFEALLSQTRSRSGANNLAVADLLTSFGVELYIADPNPPNDNYFAAALRYSKDAIAAYKAALGPDHPEVALALNSYADLLSRSSPSDPPPAVQGLLEQALSIRMKSLGPRNAETRATLVRLANLYALPTNLRRNPRLLVNADSYLRRAIASAPNGPEGDEISNKAAIELNFAKLHAEYGSARVAFAAAQDAIRLSRDWPAPEACRLVDSPLPDIARLIARKGHPQQAQDLLREQGRSACERICEPTILQRLEATILDALGGGAT